MLAQYTGRYRAWMRHSVRVICFIASCITLSIACYDLYKNFPLLRTFLETYFKETNEWLDRIFHEQFSVWMGMILYVFWPLQFVLDTLKSSELFMLAVNTAFYPLVYLTQSLWALLKLLFDLLWPVKALISLVIRSSFSIVWNILCLPYTLLRFLYSCCLGLLQVLGGFRSSVESAKFVAAQAQSKAEAQEAFSMIAYATQLCIAWSQSITNKVVRASKSVYDFVVYVGCEIGKHNYTIQVYIYDLASQYYQLTRKKFSALATGHRSRLLFRTLKMLLYGFLLFFLVNLLIVYLRERFELEGCVLCIEKEVDKISGFVQCEADKFV